MREGKFYMYILKIIALSFLMLGCSTSSLNLFKTHTSLSLLSLPTMDHGYRNLTTRVISSVQEYKAFLSSIDAQRNWEHKAAFKGKIAGIKIDFGKENLLIYRYRSKVAARAVISQSTSSTDKTPVVILEELGSTVTERLDQVFFYTVAKEIKKITFKSKQGVVTVKNSRSRTVVPKTCIAWFDGCNHCIRSASGHAICTKRYCKQKAAFRCVKWK